MTLVNPDETKTVATTIVVTRRFIETLVLTLEPRTKTWKMDNETLLLALHSHAIEKS